MRLRKVYAKLWNTAKENRDEIRDSGKPAQRLEKVIASLCFCSTLVLAVGQLLLGRLVVDLNVCGLPRVADPDVADGAGGNVAARVHHILGEGALLCLVLVLGGCQRGKGMGGMGGACRHSHGGQRC